MPQLEPPNRHKQLVYTAAIIWLFARSRIPVSLALLRAVSETRREIRGEKYEVAYQVQLRFGRPL
jgi:hypothetical protein